MIEYIFMCVILSLNPVEVDCNNEWLIVFYNQTSIQTPYGIPAGGYAWYPEQLEYKINPFYMNIRGQTSIINAGISIQKYDEHGWPILWHEIVHLIWECGHENTQWFTNYK